MTDGFNDNLIFWFLFTLHELGMKNQKTIFTGFLYTIVYKLPLYSGKNIKLAPSEFFMIESNPKLLPVLII